MRYSSLGLIALTTLVVGMALLPAKSMPVDAAAMALVGTLEKILQPRFREEMKQFGVSRAVPVVPGHDIQLSSEIIARPLITRSPAETTLLKQANVMNRDYLIAFLHIQHPPGYSPKEQAAMARGAGKNPVPLVHLTPMLVRDSKSPAYSMVYAQQRYDPRYKVVDLGPPDSVWRKVQPNYPILVEIENSAKRQVTALKQGKTVYQRVEDRLVALCPVTASQPSCLTCHTTAKQGDTLGVLVYVISPAPTAPHS